MPTLKQLTCTVEWTGSNVPLQEFQPTYGDGYVHTFIAVPPIQTPFSVHLTSHGYIAPGLAMFVYMDGEYQCNRNRRNLRIPDDNTRPQQTVIDFRVRQKEELQPDATFCGQQWKFRELNIVSDPGAALESPAPHDAQHVGTIEVVVLRCYPGSVEEKPSFKSTSRQQGVRNFTPEESSDSSSEESRSEDGSESEFGGLFDGAGDDRHNRPKSLPFGGDATSDQPSHWNNGGQSSSNQGDNSYAWGGANNSPNGNALPTSGNEWGSAPAQSPRWDTRASSSSNHFSDDWNRPSQTTQEAAQHGSSHHSNHGSRRSGRSSSSNHNARAVSTNNNWEASNPARPSPAIVINVTQSPTASRFGPPPVAEGWAEKPLPANLQPSFGFPQTPQGHASSPNGSNNSGSNKSGSNHSGSNKGNGSQNKNNGGNDWQASGGQTEGWGAAAPTIPGAWGESNDRPQETSDWNNNNGTTWDNNDNGGGTAWNEPNSQSPGGQNNGDGNTWNTTSENKGWQDTNGDASAGQAQGAQWTNEEVLKAYPDWASPSPQNQQQNTWASGNAGDNGNGSGDGKGSGDGDKPEKANWAGNDEHNAVQDEPVGLFGSKPIPASESAKREGSIKLKHSNEVPALTRGYQRAPTLGQPPVTTLPCVAGAMPTSSRAKPYWSTWNVGLSDEVLDIEEEPAAEPESEEGPLYSVPAEIAERNNMSHQVQIGKPAVYLHRVSKPKYMDSHDNPYAAFTFHYRSRAVIEKMFGVSLAETEEEEKERLSSLSKEELIEYYLKAKASASSQKSSSGSNDSNKQNPMVSGGLGLGGELANKLSQLNASKVPSEKASTDPELHWGRPANQPDAWNNPATGSNANVEGWLSNGGGGAIGSPPKGNSGGSNNEHGNDGLNANSRSHNGSGGNGNNNQNGSGHTWGNNAGGNQQAGSWNNGGGNETSWNNNGAGNATGGSWNGGGKDTNANQNDSSWNQNGAQDAIGGSWNGAGNANRNQNAGNEGENGKQNDSSWNNKGAATSSWNAGGGDNAGGGNAEIIW